MEDCQEVDLNNALIGPSDAQDIQVESKNTRNHACNDFIQINEKQIISSSTNYVNNVMNRNEDEGLPINYEHFQQVTSKRPQTSYGGIVDRQKSLQKSLQQKSYKSEAEDNNFMGSYGMKNRLWQVKYHFNS